MSGTAPAASASPTSVSGVGTTTTAPLLHYRYYAPLPLRVVNEDFALLAGFLGGLLVFAVYMGVLVGLRCLQHMRRAAPVWQQQQQPSDATAMPPPHHSQNSSNVRHFGTWSYGPPSPAFSTTAAPQAPSQRSADVRQYERGVQLRLDTAPTTAPAPPPR